MIKQLHKSLIVTILVFCTIMQLHGQGRVGISPTGQDPDPSAALDVVSPDKGLLIPRMNSVTRLSIPSPGNGLMVYDTDSNCVFFLQSSNRPHGSRYVRYR